MRPNGSLFDPYRNKVQPQGLTKNFVPDAMQKILLDCRRLEVRHMHGSVVNCFGRYAQVMPQSENQMQKMAICPDFYQLFILQLSGFDYCLGT